MLQLADNIAGRPHRWVLEIIHWARGGLVQWRFIEPKEDHLQLKPGFDGWRDCDYPSRGVPNWHEPTIEFRIADVKYDCNGAVIAKRL